MSMFRAMVTYRNGVATLVVARWEGELIATLSTKICLTLPRTAARQSFSKRSVSLSLARQRVWAPDELPPENPSACCFSQSDGLIN